FGGLMAMRLRIRAWVRNAIALALTVANKLVPKSDTILLAGTPSFEPGILELGTQLIDRGLGARLVWMSRPSRSLLPPDGSDEGGQSVAQWSLAGVWAFLRARHVVVSHGIFGCPAAGRGQTIVNAWHG